MNNEWWTMKDEHWKGSMINEKWTMNKWRRIVDQITMEHWTTNNEQRIIAKDQWWMNNKWWTMNKVQ